jgi:hypothetical protein
MRSRRATSLAELLMVMSTCSVILMTSAALLHRCMHIQSQTRRCGDVERSAWRLSDQFRRDVHQTLAGNVELENLGENNFLRLKQPGNEVLEYSYRETAVRRVLSRNGKALSQEEFAFPPRCMLEIRQEESPPRLVLTVAGESYNASTAEGRRTPEAGTLSVGLQIEAVLGRHLQLEPETVEENTK